MRLRFTVSDTGIGITPEVQARLFQPFEQGNARLARRKGGAGLGLAICKRVVELMGGRIGVQSASGKGSTFWFELPFGVPARAPVEAKAPASTLRTAPARGGRSLKLLVAEDAPANQIVVRAMLEKLGHRVQIVADGREAVAAASAGAFDLILMDVQMPDMDGYEAARRIRALNGAAAKTPIVALTAFAQDSDREKAFAAGMTGYISKPIRAADLHAAIERSVTPETSSRHGAVGGELDEATLIELSDTVGNETFGRLIDSFLRDAARSLDEFRAEVAANRSGRIRATAHRLMGLFGQFGASRAADAALAVELAQDDELRPRSDELLARGQAAIAAMRAAQTGPP